MKEGKLVILETGRTMIDAFVGESTKIDVMGHRHSDMPCGEFIKEVAEGNLHMDETTIFIETYQLFETRHCNSYLNKLFAFVVSKSLDEGKNIVIIVPDAVWVNKRIREKSIILSLPEEKKGLLGK